MTSRPVTPARRASPTHVWMGALALVVAASCHDAAPGLDESHADQATASFSTEGGGRCAATLIAPTALVTAAHCVPSPLEGGRVTFDGPTGAVTLPVDHTAADPEFDRATSRADLAVLFLALPAPVAPVPLAVRPLDPSVLLRPVRVVVFDPTLDPGSGRRSVRLTPGELREDDLFLEQSTPPLCRGSSGAPVFVSQDGGWVLAGVVSGGDPECQRTIRAQRVDARVHDLLALHAADRGGDGLPVRKVEGVVGVALLAAAVLVAFVTRRRRRRARPA